MKKYLVSTFKLVMLVSILSLMFTSCIPQKKMLYLQVQNETDTLTTFKNERKIEYKVQSGDNL